MYGEGAEFSETADAATAGSADKETRDRSTIDFPYLPLEAGIEVATALYNRIGFGSCEQDELAAEMGQTISGAFRQKTSAARTFGLVAKDGRSAFVLTDLGKRMVSPEGKPSAVVDAFLNVPLYREIYDKFRGHNLPPAKALEREMESLGVAQKQTDRARQAFERSAQFAGFFDNGKERLVRPRRAEAANKSTDATQVVSRPAERDESLQSRGEDRLLAAGRLSLPPDIDPIIAGLINRLPKTGSNWPMAERQKWLQVLQSSFDLVYQADEDNADT